VRRELEPLSVSALLEPEQLARAHAGVKMVVGRGRGLLRNASAELLGQRDDDAFGAADVAEPIAVLVLLQRANEFGAGAGARCRRSQGRGKPVARTPRLLARATRLTAVVCRSVSALYFNPDNVNSLLRYLPEGSFAASLV